MFRVIAFLLLLCDVAFAGGRGGHNTRFDPNLFGGSWSCFRTQASGACGTGTFIQYFDAPCDGVSSDVTALLAWIAYGITQNPTQVKLYIPTGSSCVFGERSLSFDNNAGFDDAAIKNSIVWAYGAKLSGLYIGGRGVFNDGTHSAKVQTVSAGASTVTLVIGAEISRFSVGDAVMLAALATQAFGYPPNFYFFEYRTITAINGSVVTLNAPTAYAYKSTYPDIGTLESAPALGGPATLYRLAQSWNTSFTLYGAFINQAGPVSGGARNIILHDVSYSSDSDGWAPTMSENIWINFSEMRSPEVDKLITYMQSVRSTGQTIIGQSGSIASTIVFNSFTVRNRFTGWFGNTQFINSRIVGPGPIADMFVGPTSYGHGVTMLVDGSAVNTATFSTRDLPISSYTYEGGGTFSLLKSAPGSQIDTFTGLAVPGQKYAFSGHNGGGNSVPLTVFTITDVREDGTKLYFDTDIVGSLPTPLCGGVACTDFYPYPAMTGGITQRFSGPADLTQYAPP